MIDFLKIKDIIIVLPLLIIYVLPGYVFISIENFILNKDQKDDKNSILKSIVISYIIINFEKLMFNILRHILKFNFSIDISSPIAIITTVCFTILIAYVFSIFIQSQLSVKLLKKLKITRSMSQDVITDIVDFQLGMWLRIFLSSEELIYTGNLRKFEKISEGCYTIVLSNFILYDYSGETIINYENDNTEWVLINVKDNYRIELIYNSESKKIIG